MKADISRNPYSDDFNAEWNALMDKIYSVKHLLVYNRDHVEFLTHITKNFNKDLDLYFQENVFVCRNCGQLAVLNRFCPAHDFKVCERHPQPD